MKRNILISSAGKRVELLQEFRRELERLTPEGRILAADMNPSMAPACVIADEAFTVPRATANSYIPSLLEICVANDVRVVVPTIDTELEALAAARPLFLNEGIEVLVPDPDFTAACRDKRKSEALFQKIDIRTPEPRDKRNPVFPMFAKPYDGSLSTNIHIIHDSEALTKEILEDPKLLFMELIDKKEYKEFTVDIYFGCDGKAKGIVPRERIEVRSGEINKGATRKNFILDYLRDRIDRLKGVRGCVCMQLFFRESDNDIVGIEINPRFGGGYPLSYYAGANFPALIIKEYIKNEPTSYSDDWTAGTLMLRFDSQVIVKP